MKHFLLITLLSFFSYSGFGQCDPTGLAANNTTLNGAILSWSANSATGFSVKWKIIGTPGWSPATPGVYQTATNITVDTLLFDTLTSGTTYEWRVRPYGCTPTSTWTDGPAFTTLASCPVSALQNVAGFNPDPVYALWYWCYDTLTLTNTSSCDIRVRPEFDLSHDSSPIAIDDFDLKWYNPGGLWQDINYTIDANGHAIGIWGFPMGDTTGVVINTGVTQPIVVRVRFRPGANFGTYSALWKTNEVDSLGNVIQPLALDSTSLRFFSCSSFGPDSTTFDSVSCPLASDGSAEVFVSNGSGNYSYNWSNGGTTSSISNLSGGSYDCVIYDSLWQCSHTESFIINEPSVIDVNIIGTHISCFDSSDGTLNTIASGGSGTYKYAWTDQWAVPLPPNPSHSNLSAGIYSITLIDMGGCTGSATDNFEIIEPGAIQDSTIKVNNLSCDPLLPNGSINLYLSGGTLPYSILWGNGDSVEIRNNLAANSYNITVTDSNNCPFISILETIIYAPTTPSATQNVTDNSSCNSLICNGEVSTADGPGATPYTYLWDDPLAQTTQTAIGLCAGTYTCIVTDTNSCSTTLPTVNVQNSMNLPQVAFSSTNLQCAGDSVGSATIFLISNLSYCASSPGSNDYTNIELISLIGDNGNDINNSTSGACDTYEDYTSQNATVSAGQSYSVNVTLGTCNFSGSGGSAQYLDDSTGVFIDWNIDGDFDDTDEKIEVVYSNMGTTQSPISHTISFTVPNSAIAGATRMRVVSQAQMNHPTLPDGPVSACAVGDYATTYVQPWYGATEDYTVIISGGSPPSYLWSNGDTTQQISNLTEGTYTCTVTDSSGCSNSGSVTIIEPSPILVVENITHINCFGDSTGTASLIISGGTPPYSLNWYGSDTNLLFAGEHNYTITDAMGCIYNDSIMIDQPQQPLSIISSKINVNCFEENNGSIDITTNGGSGAHSFTWSNGAITEDISNLVDGEYSVIVNDTSNCTLYDTINISEPAILQIDSVSVIQQTSCANPNGSIDIDVTGGTVNYNYLWSNLATLQDINSLTEGTYSVIVTDQKGCTDSVGFTISLATTPININFTTSNYNGAAISCYNEADGSIFSEGTGGEGNLNYSWSNGSTNDTVNNLGPGSYTLTITDSVGCTNSDTISLTQPGPLSANHVLSQSSCTGANAVISVYLDITGGTAGYQENWYGDNPDTLLPGVLYTYTVSDTNICILTDTFTATFATPLIVNDYQTDVLCHGDSSGAAAFVVSGGSPPYNYLWSNGETNPTAINLIAGTYTCTISDQSGCSYLASTTVSQPVNPLSATSSLIDSINCYGYNTGSAYISADGGVPFTTSNEYTYLWEDGQTDSIASNLFGGYNIFSVTDDNGCILTDSILIPENDSIFTTNTLSNNNAFNISCNGGNDGSIDITINGGVAPFIINWSNGEDSTFIDSLIANTYYLTITDTFGCTFNDTISLSEPNSLSLINYSQTNISCNGYSDGNFSFYIDGGVPNYILSGLINITISELDTLQFNNVTANSNIINITDQNGCVATDSIVITEPGIIAPILSISDYNGVNISCKGFDDGYINIDSITGGNGGYDIIWIDQISGNTIINGDSLTVGYYNLTINDSIGCPPYNNTFFISEPNFALDSYIDSFDVSCNSYCDGQLIATAFDGTGPYTYDWTTSNGTGPFSDNDTLIGCTGNYSLTITDANGCENQLSSTLIEPSPLSINLDLLVDASFNGATNGSIQTHATGGNGGYNYLWDSGQNTSDIYGLAAGQYELAINDLLGCVDTALFIINEPPPIAINFDSTYSILSTSCYDNCDGKIFIDPVISPAAFYTCYWEGPNGYTSTLEDITGLCEGTYTINIITSGDSIPFTFYVSEPDQLTTSLASDSIMCYGSTALVTAYTYGGTTPYSYSWNTPGTGNNISVNLHEGNHIVTVTDANGCIVQDSLILSNPDTMDIYLTVDSIKCHNGSDGKITASVMLGGTPNFEYSIDNGINYQTNNLFNNLSSGSYTITVKDGNDCKQSIDTTIINPAPIDIQVDIMNTDTMVSCDGWCDAVVIFDYVFVNGIGNSSWEQWSGGATNGSLCPGLYNCTLTDDNGCSTTINNIEITEPDLLEFDTIWSTPTTCHNYGDDGEATAVGSGGTAPLQYLWSNGEATQTTTNTLNTGQHYCIITDDNDCTDTAYVSVISNPVPFYIGISYDTAVTVLSVDTSTGGIPVSFEWNTAETNQNITPLNNGIYWALGTDANGCVSDTAFYTVTNFVTSISDITNLFKIYPNPTNGLINVYSKENIETIEVFNNLGDLIYSKNNTQHSQELYQLDISGNASGIYMIRLKVNNQIVNHKIILQ